MLAVSDARLTISRRLIRRARARGMGSSGVGGGAGAGVGVGGCERVSEAPSRFMRLLRDMTLRLLSGGGGEMIIDAVGHTGVEGGGGFGISRVGPMSFQIAAYVSARRSSMAEDFMRPAFSFFSSAVSRRTSCSLWLVLGEAVQVSTKAARVENSS